MRILLWYWGRRGGGAQHAFCLARALAARPDVSLELSVSAQGELADRFAGLGVPVHFINTFNGPAGFLAATLRLPWIIGTLRAQARAMGADVVLSVMSHVWTPLAAPLLARDGIAFVPIIHDARPHPGDPALLWRWRMRRELGAARAAVVLSDAVAQVVAAEAPGLPLIRLPLGAHLPNGVPAPAESAGEDFLFFGRMRAYKGLDLLRDAWALLLRTHPGARLRVVGQGNPEAVAPGLAALPGVTVEARWVSEAEMPGLVASARALVLPYREASQSGVLPLAMACGVPVIATAVGGLSEQMGDGAGGLLVAPEAAALAGAMARMLDREAHARMAAAALRVGRGLSDWDAQAATLVRALA
ncbi:glycosyltransferase involved in cell wall biosynthesis [Humitalea rosea]|uniref:Glycosyltransferase involved in cell wall biosynthesis n=1 Tax=Humitalea rosea TaxID=990373 RepID=A0A2W7IFZ7_9PROT|nr:glycosyltransferase [Humitalea rosea]PZW45876.1 glycosyltransferase involved in cell wall biosynthesis [Humitalea rosea]